MLQRQTNRIALCLTLAAACLGGTVTLAQDAAAPTRVPGPQATPAQSATPAQQAGGTATLRLSTRIVVLDVVVTDKKGNVVTSSLDKDDFTIVEDKIPQTIRSFEPPAEHILPAGVEVKSAADLKRIGDAPVSVLVLDELNSRFEDSAFVSQSMVKFLQKQPPVLTQPTVLLQTTNTRFVQMHDYTQNRDELIDVVKHHVPAYPTKMMAGRGGAVAVERMVQTLAALEQIAQASSGTPGRKNVVWVGAGFPSADLVGLDEKTAATIEAAVQQCTNMLLASRITMYTINPTMNSTVTLDVETPEDLTVAETENGGDPYEGTLQFSTLAPATGGRAFLSRNDINNEIAEGIRQGANYYTMSYTPSNRSDDLTKYRKIVIVMKDPNLRATTRNGYYPPTAATQNIASAEPPKQAKNQLALDLSSAVNSTISYNGLDVSANKDGANYVVKVKGSALDWRTLSPQQDQTEATVMAAWFDGKGKLLGHSAKELTAVRTSGDVGSDAVFLLPVTLTGSPARLRLIVRDASNGRMGTTDIQKP